MAMILDEIQMLEICKSNVFSVYVKQDTSMLSETVVGPWKRPSARNAERPLAVPITG